MSSVVMDVLLQLHEISAVKFGEFVLKSGFKSPIYFDLRSVIGFPKLMALVSDVLWDSIPSEVKFDNICGVPYTALPLATIMSTKHDVPMLIRRKEGAKSYGTKKVLEGRFEKGQKCLIVEDVVTSGLSVLETAKILRDEGLIVTDAIVLLDREQGSVDNLRGHGITLHPVVTMTELLKVLLENGKINQATVESVQQCLKSNPDLIAPKKSNGRLQTSFKDRASLAKNVLAKKLFEIMHTKQSNLCVAVDITESEKILDIADVLGPYICILKLHVDIISDFSTEFIIKLKERATKSNFLIFEDRKLADIGHTGILQYTSGVHHIVEWAHFVTVHPLVGAGLVRGLKEAANASMTNGDARGIVLVAQMSSAGNLITTDYTNAAVSMAASHQDFVLGFISQSDLTDDPSMIHLTPGVQFNVQSDKHGQQYIEPEAAVKERGADIVIVGRGITSANNIAESAARYKKAAWNAYSNRISQVDEPEL